MKIQNKKTKIKQLFIRHNKKIAAYIASAIFVGLFLLVVILKSEDNPCYTNSKNNTKKSVDTRQLRMLRNLGCIFQQQTCNIECHTIPTGEIDEKIVIEFERWCDMNTTLVIKNVQFPANTIESKWLQHFPLEIKSLQLQECKFDSIAKNGFIGHPFEKLYGLVIIGAQINYLQRHYFDNMNSLVKFSLQGTTDSNVQDFRIEQGVFGDLNAIDSIQIHHYLTCADQVRNLTGHLETEISKLVELDLRYNYIDELKEHTFINAPLLKSVFLSQNKLQKIHREAFWYVNLQKIDISENQLKSLENGTFKFLKVNEFYDLEQLVVHGNPWMCTCSLQWLKDLYLEDNSLISRVNPLMCNRTILFDEIDFGCSKTTTSSNTEQSPSESSSEQLPSITESSSDQSPIITTPEYIYSIEVACKNYLMNPVNIPNNVKRSQGEIIYIPVKNHAVRFSFQDLDYKVTTMAEISGNLKNLNLIWFNTNDTFDRSCISQLSRKVPLENLKRDNTYTMCLLPDGETTVSPFSCFGLKIPKEYDLRTWIPNKSKTTFYAVYICVLILVIIFVALTVFYCIRQHPNLIRGNKRVIIVGKKKADAIIIPKDYETPVYLPSLSYPGYLTPKFPEYEKVRQRTRRKFSDNSISSYITELSPRPRQRDIMIQTRKPNVFYGEPSGPPPLPPFHPARRNIDRNDTYSSCS